MQQKENDVMIASTEILSEYIKANAASAASEEEYKKFSETLAKSIASNIKALSTIHMRAPRARKVHEILEGGLDGAIL